MRGVGWGGQHSRYSSPAGSTLNATGGLKAGSVGCVCVSVCVCVCALITQALCGAACLGHTHTPSHGCHGEVFRSPGMCVSVWLSVLLNHTPPLLSLSKRP